MKSQSGDKDRDGFKDNVDKCLNTSDKNTFSCGLKNVLAEFDRSVYFNLNEVIFAPETINKLNIIAEIMEEYSEASFDIVGYSEANGKENKLLLKKRAKAVIDYLVSKGIST